MVELRFDDRFQLLPPPAKIPFVTLSRPEECTLYSRFRAAMRHSGYRFSFN